MMFSGDDVKECVASYEVEPLFSLSSTTKSKGAKNSYVWKHFGRLILVKDNKRRHVCCEHVFCLLCLSKCRESEQTDSEADDPAAMKTLFSCFGDIQRYASTVSTGNLASHLRNKHNVSDEQPKRTLSLTDFYGKRPRNALDSSSARKQDERWFLARDLAIWFCRALIPFDVVENDGTNDFMKKYHVVGPEEKLPVRTTISRKALDDVYKVTVNFVKARVKDCSPFGCVTTDLWTDRYMRNSYMTFTYHCISDSFKLERFVLQTSVLNEKKTAERINIEIGNVQERYELFDKELSIVTDAGANMKAGVRLSGLDGHLCIGHGIHNLVTKDGVAGTPELLGVCKKAKEACKAVRYRAPDLERENQVERGALVQKIVDAGEILEGEEMDPLLDEDDDDLSTSSDSSETASAGAQEPSTSTVFVSVRQRGTTVKLDVPTRWHSLLIMLESLGENKVAVNSVLSAIGRQELQFSPHEWKLIFDLIRFLTSFRRSVEILSSSTHCTTNLSLLLRANLEHNLADNDDDPLVIMKLKMNMRNRLDYRFPVTKFNVLSAILDPRCLDLPSVENFVKETYLKKSEFLAREVAWHIQSRQVTFFPSPAASSGSSQESESRAPCSSTAATEIMDLSRKFSTADRSQQESIDAECEIYIRSAQRNHVADGDILHYWGERSRQFPWLATLVRKLFCIQATSTESERTFSVAGLVLTAKRNRLDPAKADKIIFIHNNYETCKNLLQ